MICIFLLVFFVWQTFSANSKLLEYKNQVIKLKDGEQLFIEKLNDKYFKLCLIIYLLLLIISYLFFYEAIWLLPGMLLAILLSLTFIIPGIFGLQFIWGLPVFHIFGYLFLHLKLNKKGWFGFILLVNIILYMIALLNLL